MGCVIKHTAQELRPMMSAIYLPNYAFVTNIYISNLAKACSLFKQLEEMKLFTPGEKKLLIVVSERLGNVLVYITTS